MYCMSCMGVETVAIRFPRETWKRVRVRAVARGESGLSWLSRCAEVCLADGRLRDGGEEEAPAGRGSDVAAKKIDEGVGRGGAELPRCRCGHLVSVHRGSKACGAVGCGCEKLTHG